jgi:peptidoglycan hydrolase-like protein with peptidoglycan-binding domain
VLSDSPSDTFKPGCIREIQNALRKNGFDAPTSDHLDAVTRRQIAHYQRGQSLPDTGYPDDATLKKLGLDPAKLHRTNP